jgi:hypothetical protein
MPRIFILNFISTSRLHAQGENLVFDMKNFKAHEKAVVLVRAKEIVQPGLNSLLLDLRRLKLVHLAKNMIHQTRPGPPQKNSSIMLLTYQRCSNNPRTAPIWNSPSATFGRHNLPERTKTPSRSCDASVGISVGNGWGELRKIRTQSRNSPAPSDLWVQAPNTASRHNFPTATRPPPSS